MKAIEQYFHLAAFIFQTAAKCTWSQFGAKIRSEIKNTACMGYRKPLYFGTSSFVHFKASYTAAVIKRNSFDDKHP